MPSTSRTGAAGETHRGHHDRLVERGMLRQETKEVYKRARNWSRAVGARKR
ncbi:hypothetical protein ACH4PX_22375 [Streptomyces anulatus]